MPRLIPILPAALCSAAVLVAGAATEDPADAGECYRQGSAARKAGKAADARRLLVRAAELGHTDARYLAAIMAANGEGGPVDRALARKYHGLAAEAGDVRSMADLGVMLLDGDGGPADPKAGLAWLEKAAGRDAFAAVRLAGRFEHGDGTIPRDPARAALWYEKAASTGLPACASTGVRIRKALATTPEQKLAEFRTAMTAATAASDPSESRAKAFAAYCVALYDSGLTPEAVGPASLHGLADLIATDFYAVHRARLLIPGRLQPTLDRRLSADQRDIVKRLVAKAAGKPTEDPVVKPGQGWAAAFPGGAIPRAPVAATPATTRVATTPPPPVYRTFREYRDDYKRNLNGHWLVISSPKGRSALSETLRFEMSGPTGYAYDSRGTAHAVVVTERAAPGGGMWVRIVVRYPTFSFEGTLHEIGSFDGNVLGSGGTVIGTWTMGRRVDLDYAAAGKTALAAYNTEYAASVRIGAESRAARKAGDNALATSRGVLATEHVRRSESRAAEAVHYFAEAVRLRQNDTHHLYDLGSAHYAAQQFDEAVAKFDRVIAVASGSTRYQARYNRMLARYYGRKHAEALVDADALIAEIPPKELAGNDAQTHFMRGDILWWLERRPESDAAYAKAFELNPQLKGKPRAADTREGMMAVYAKTSAETNRILGDMNAATAEANRKLAEANRLRREGRSDTPPKTGAAQSGGESPAGDTKAKAP